MDDWALPALARTAVEVLAADLAGSVTAALTRARSFMDDFWSLCDLIQDSE
jgi:hypothetical protein